MCPLIRKLKEKEKINLAILPSHDITFLCLSLCSLISLYSLYTLTRSQALSVKGTVLYNCSIELGVCN